jgi:hypothetical protein
MQIKIPSVLPGIGSYGGFIKCLHANPEMNHCVFAHIPVHFLVLAFDAIQC